MKKLLFLFYLISQAAAGQSVMLAPANLVNSVNLSIKNSLNQPGFVHSSSFTGGPSFGTVFKPDGAYLQTFTNHPLKFAVNNGDAEMILTTAGNVIITGSTKIKNVNIKQLKLTGNTDAYNPLFPATNDGFPYETRIAHGLIAANIISIKLVIVADVGFSICEEYSYSPGYRAAISFDPTYLHVWNYQASSQNIRNKPFKVLITYKN
jgi:hypothetical protein